MSAETKTKTEKTEKVEKKEVVIEVNRDNFALVAPGIYSYEAKGDVDDCKAKGAFKCVQSKNFGVRPGDIVICKDKEKAIFVVVK